MTLCYVTPSTATTNISTCPPTYHHFDVFAIIKWWQQHTKIWIGREGKYRGRGWQNSKMVSFLNLLLLTTILYTRLHTTTLILYQHHNFMAAPYHLHFEVTISFFLFLLNILLVLWQHGSSPMSPHHLDVTVPCTNNNHEHPWPLQPPSEIYLLLYPCNQLG